jgi:hypothetical protein
MAFALVLFASAGRSVEIDETYMDVVIALSGSGNPLHHHDRPAAPIANASVAHAAPVEPENRVHEDPAGPPVGIHHDANRLALAGWSISMNARPESRSAVQCRA